jgi:serine/threonine-protein kinase
MTAEFGVGQHIGDYEILSILGMGGMGKVYKVRNIIADRVEAMKILLPDLNSNQSLADRFLREIRLLGTLNHPNIAALRTALTFQNQLVMVMEFVEGETLANRLARAPLSTAETVKYADQILSALAYAHKQNIIHRDIKPANMMLTPQGVVKLMDFGIARSATDGSLTSTGTTLGSLNYMPPEQVRGEAADARSDIYSFGVSLYEMLTGKLPFQSDSQYSLMTAHLNQVPATPISLRGDLPPALSEIIMMAIAKEPGNRFQSADAFRAALGSVPVSELPAADTTLTATPGAKSTGATTLMDTPLTPRVATPTPSRKPTPAPATVPVSSATPPAGVVPPPRAAQPSSSRGVWLAIGVLIGVGVIIAAGMYIPRHLGTHADPNKSAFPAEGSSATTASTPGPNNSSTKVEAKNDFGSGSDVVNIQTSQGSMKVDANGNVSIHSPNGSMQVDADTGSLKISGKNGEKVAVRGGNPLPARVETPAAPDVSALPPGPSPEEIAKAEDDADRLNVRAVTVEHSIETMRQQQQAAGYNLRADISASQDRMQAYLAKGNAALKAQDLKSAQKYFDMAETELGKLEKFLGH